MLTNGLCITVECIRVCFLTVKYISLLLEDFSLTVGKRTKNQSQFSNCCLPGFNKSKISTFAFYYCFESMTVKNICKHGKDRFT